MISGIQAHICDRCVNQSYQILQEESNTKTKKGSPKFNLIKPQDVKKFLDQYVVGQDEAKKVLAFYNDARRANDVLQLLKEI